MRVNSQDFIDKMSISINLNNKNQSSYKYGDIDFREINVVWFWRWNHYDFSYTRKLGKDNFKIASYMRHEMDVINSLFFNELSHCLWVGHRYINKLVVLNVAKECGLIIPETLVTNRKSDILTFIGHNKSIIVKPLSEPFFYSYDNANYGLYTQLLTMRELAEMPEKIFPCLVQNCIKKDFEIRVFYIDEDFYSAAILSQANSQTEVDFRKYNFENPNRLIPCDIPLRLKLKIVKFMHKMNLKTGSLDLIKSGKDYVFLEVNPVGQFGMISKPCNYDLDKVIAKYLMKNDFKSK